MNQKIIAAQFLNLGAFLQNQFLPELLSRFKQHNIIQSYIETATIFCYSWAIWLNPNLAEAHYKLGRLFQKQKKWQEAATAYEESTKIGDFKLAEAYYHLGRMLLIQEQFEESIDALEQAIKLEPEQSWYYRTLGDILSKKGELAKGIKNYQIASQKQIIKTHPHVVLSTKKEQHLSPPNFIIIGQAKCGTSSLYDYLTQHPQILPAIKKEIKFWNVKFNFDKGLDWYLAHFPAISSEESFITGEATPAYLDFRKAAVPLFQEFPSMKLIVLLRNPVDRAISHYYMRVREHSDNRSVEKVIFSGVEVITTKSDVNSYNYCNISLYIKRSQYIESLSQWMDIFPKNQFLILKSEDFFADPATTLNQVFQFLGVEPYQLQEYRKINKGSYPPISESMRQILSDYFRPFNQQLEEYLDQKFNWN